MNIDPHQIPAQVDAVLAGLPPIDSADSVDRDDAAEAAMIDAHARRLEEAHQILVDALESVEKG